MPKWGLTKSQRLARPWGLDPALLVPGKVITDPVHGDIYVTELERRLLDSPPLQRLRRIRQLGNSHLVYPAAGHSRLSHSLGALRVSQNLLDAVADNRTGPRHTRDLLDEWDERGNLPDGHSVLDVGFGEATVLARMGGLLHDICHVPLGHTIEDDLKVLTRHDYNLGRLAKLWAQFEPEVLRALEEGMSKLDPDGPSLKAELQRLIISGASGASEPSTYPFVADIVGNTICADLLDYLQRDHLFAGLPIALGDRFMDSFYVTGSDHKHFAKKMVVRIARRGRPRNDVVTELGKCLRYRYELTERVLTHHAKVAADAMVGKLLEMWSDSVWIARAGRNHQAVVARLGHSDIDALKAAIFAEDTRQIARDAPDLTSTTDPTLKRSAALKELDEAVEEVLEQEFISRSDDGLLEHLARLGGENPGDTRLQAVSHLARAVLDRKLFKLIGHAESAADTALASEKYKRFGPPPVRREMEKRAADLADLAHGYDVVVWLPNPDMRLKVAEVLVDDGVSIAPLDRVNTAGKEIVEQHRHLWSVGIYAALDVERSDHANRASVLLSQLKDEMDLRIVRWDGEIVKSLAELTVEEIAEYLQLAKGQRESLALLEVNALGGDPTFRNRLQALWTAALENGLTQEAFPAGLWP